jgi:NADH:ubiquinone oxidoreductase subunit H
MTDLENHDTPVNIIEQKILPVVNGYGEVNLTIALKIVFVLCLFIWARATYPRVRFSNLMSFCWKGILPIAFSLLLFYAGLFVAFNHIFEL